MRLIEKGEALSGFGGNGKAVIADNVAREAAGATEADCRAIIAFAEHSWAVRGFDHVGHMARGADIGDADGYAVVEDIKQFADKDARVERDRLTGFEIDFEAGFVAQLAE